MDWTCGPAWHLKWVEQPNDSACEIWRLLAGRHRGSLTLNHLSFLGFRYIFSHPVKNKEWNVIKSEFLPCQFALVKERLPWWRLALHHKVIYHLQTNISRQITPIHGRGTQRAICGLLQAIFGFICSGTIRAVRKRRSNEPFSKQNHLDLDRLGLTKPFQVGFSGCSTPMPEDQMCSFSPAGESKHIRTQSKPKCGWCPRRRSDLALDVQKASANAMSYCFHSFDRWTSPDRDWWGGGFIRLTEEAKTETWMSKR